MSAAARTHRKLPGGGLTWSGRGSLWEGEDHLLEATTLLIAERYRRFFFHEIRAFVVQHSSVRSIWAWLQGAVGFICAIVACGTAWYGFSNPGEDWHVQMYILAWMFGSVAFLCFLMLAINLALGPSCRCSVLTSTGWQALAAPARLGPALRVQALVFPLIEAAQARAPAAKTAAPLGVL